VTLRSSAHVVLQFRDKEFDTKTRRLLEPTFLNVVFVVRPGSVWSMQDAALTKPAHGVLPSVFKGGVEDKDTRYSVNFRFGPLPTRWSGLFNTYRIAHSYTLCIGHSYTRGGR
jgi:hypothetical protein